MNLYRCYGEIPYLQYCSCEHCDGHEATWRIDRSVLARSPEHAAQVVRDDYRQHPFDMEDPPDAEIILDHLRIQEETEERRMRAMDQPMLFVDPEVQP
ncbi:MAG: hypothetical protein R2932_59170 [Caldilineaceae bacterium]